MATTSDGLSQEERDAVKNRAKELRAEAKAGKDRAAGEALLLKAISEMEADEQVLAEGLHEIASKEAPQLMPKTWYGFPAYANAEGKVVFFFQPAAKFKTRYSTLGFSDPAQLDDGDIWPTSYALAKLTPATKKTLTELIRRAVG
ncbi:hypothetical protein [Microbacterium sp. P01]|uniref:hypothetical protein n=1 Tax=unclassified Microbacterium TaxID=2609290 RepID=UPI00366CC469